MRETRPLILLIEDDVSLRESLSQMLGDHGYQTASAGTLREGWTQLENSLPRLCLLDLNLPDGSGLDLLRKIPEHELGTRVVVMTAFDLRHARPGNLENTLVEWLTKPVNPDDLLAIVEREMGEKQAAGSGQ